VPSEKTNQFEGIQFWGPGIVGVVAEMIMKAPHFWLHCASDNGPKIKMTATSWQLSRDEISTGTGHGNGTIFLEWHCVYCLRMAAGLSVAGMGNAHIVAKSLSSCCLAGV